MFRRMLLTISFTPSQHGNDDDEASSAHDDFHVQDPGVAKSAAERLQTEYNPPATRPKTPVFKTVLEPTTPSQFGGDDETTCDAPNQPPHSTDFIPGKNASILDYLNPQLHNNPEILAKARETAGADGLVVIQNAFQVDFANYAWGLVSDDRCTWRSAIVVERNGFKSHNHKDPNCPDNFDIVRSVFAHDDSKQWIGDMLGRDTKSEHHVLRGSIYKIGDYSSWHSDNRDFRTAAIIWNLSKDWLPEWGGSFVWSSAPSNQTYHHPTFNTLIMFSVGQRSSHYVTPVTRHSEGHKRVGMVGWYGTKGIQGMGVTSLDDPIEDLFDSRAVRRNLTVRDCLHLKSMNVSTMEDAERRDKVQAMIDTIYDEQLVMLEPDPTVSVV